MRRPRTIGVRLALFNGGLVLAALIGLGGAALVAVDQVLVAGAERILVDELLDVVRALEPGRLDPAAIEALLVQEAAEEHVYDVHYRVTARDGAPLASSSRPFWSRLPWRSADPEGEVWFETHRPEDSPHRIRVARRVVVTPWDSLQLEVAIHLEPEDRAMATLQLGAALAVPAVLVVAGALGAFMARRALAPVDDIERAARTIGAGPLGRRLPATGSGDELDRLVTTLNAMLERLERASARNLAFAGDVAHEVRTPLAVIRARTEESLAAADPASRGPLEHTLEAIGRLEDMVRNLLTLSRAEEGVVGAARAACDLTEVAREVVTFFAAAAEARGVILALAPGPRCPVLADRPALSRALANLVDNAVSYAPAGTTVTVAVGGTPDVGVVTVLDEGPGVPPELRPRLFDRFVRGPAGLEARPDGAGLGLALVRAVARQLAGDAEHEPHSPGSAFRLWIPRSAPPGTPAGPG